MANWNFKARQLGYQNEAEMMYDLYVNLELSQRQIARMLNVVKSSVERRMYMYGIDARPVGRRKKHGRSRFKDRSQPEGSPV